MRKLLFGSLLLVFVATFGVGRLGAQHEGHGQGAKPETTDKAKPAAEKPKDPNRPKPENQPGKVMNAEELAASHADHHKLDTLEGGGVLPEGWKHRFDLPNMKIEQVRFVPMGNGFHVTSGPPGIYYQPARTASGNYTVKATFTQVALGEHREGYGFLIGGADLDGAGQRYTYFLIRQDGKYLVKQRNGANTQGVMDWTVSPAIKPFGDDKKNMTNAISIAVGADAVRFLINGTEVASRPRADLDTDGIVGLRVNHLLDLHVDGFTVEPGAGTSTPQAGTKAPASQMADPDPDKNVRTWR